jgi:hypothetical protein
MPFNYSPIYKIYIRKLLIGLLLIIIALIILTESSNAQTTVYPKTTGYFSVLNPVGTWNKDGFTSNFSGVYTVAFPFGINLLKSDKFGISFEIAPAIRTENNISKVSSINFHPGAMFRFKHGFTFIGRMAFETNGRFGVTPVFNKVLIKGKDASFFVSVPIPVRFGNNIPSSVTTGLQLGVSF